MDKMVEDQEPVEKKDMLDRKAAWIERAFDKLFAAVQQNVFATLLVLSIGMNFWQSRTIDNLNELRLADNAEFKDEMINEVRRTVERELPKKMAPIEAKQDSISKNVDTSLYNLNGTVESVKQYIKKKTK